MPELQRSWARSSGGGPVHQVEVTAVVTVGWLVGYYLMGPATSLAGGRSTWSAEASAEVLVAGRLRSRVGGCGHTFQSGPLPTLVGGWSSPPPSFRPPQTGITSRPEPWALPCVAR